MKPSGKAPLRNQILGFSTLSSWLFMLFTLAVNVFLDDGGLLLGMDVLSLSDHEYFILR
jgi:hypothetical protein